MYRLINKTTRDRRALILILLLAIGPVTMAAMPAAVPPAYADDDDGDDGDDDGGGYGGGASYGNGDGPPLLRGGRPPRILRQLMRPFSGRQVARPRAAAAPPPRFAEREIVAIGLSDANLAALEADGYVVAAQTPLPVVGDSIVKLEVPDDLGLEEARDAVRALNPSGRADFNHYYRTGEAEGEAAACDGPHCWPRDLAGWPVEVSAPFDGCRPAGRVGMIDTGINPEHETFATGRLQVDRLGTGELPDSGRQHGTAVAALLVGASDSRTPGLIPDAQLFAVDAFRKAGGSDRAEAFDLVVAIDHLLAQEIDVLNMSLTGDANETLRAAIETGIAAHGVTFVAAVGNDGPRADALYPAAYPEVVAVTAVDRRKRPYRRAGQGGHVDVASPGVEVWTAASVRGARPKTGTSFAAPFVTAVAAMMRAADPALTPAEMERRLTATAEDLGEPGKDPVYGWGLLDAAAACAGGDDAEPVLMD